MERRPRNFLSRLFSPRRGVFLDLAKLEHDSTGTRSDEDRPGKFRDRSRGLGRGQAKEFPVISRRPAREMYRRVMVARGTYRAKL